MIAIVMLLSVALLIATVGFVRERLVHQTHVSARDKQLSDQQISHKNERSKMQASYEKRLSDMQASYDERLVIERTNAEQAGVGRVRPVALRARKEINGAWRSRTQELVLAFVLADGEVRSLAGDFGDLDTFQISPEVKDAIKAFTNGVTRAVLKIPRSPLS